MKKSGLFHQTCLKGSAFHPRFLPFFIRPDRSQESCGFQLVLCYIFKIELVEMREPAVAALNRQVAGADYDIMRAGDLAIATGCILYQFPDRVLSDFCQGTCCIYILNTRDEDPGCTTVFAGNLGLVRNRLDDLVRNQFAMVTVCTVFREDEPIAHGRYWIRPGSLTCCLPSGDD